jgi:hypothetical protein
MDILICRSPFKWASARIAAAIVEIAKKSTNKHVKVNDLNVNVLLMIQYSKTLLQHNDSGITFN